MDTRVHRSPATSAAAASASSTRPAISIQLSKVISPSWGTSAVGKAVRPFEHNVSHGDRFGKQRRRFLSQLAMDIHLGRRKEQRG